MARRRRREQDGPEVPVWVMVYRASEWADVHEWSAAVAVWAREHLHGRRHFAEWVEVTRNRHRVRAEVLRSW